MLWLDALRIEQDDFSLTADWKVARGEKVAIIGASGAGKSTLLGAIAGFVPVTAGRVLWEGHDIGHTAPGKRPLSILFQDNNLFPHLDVTANVALGLRPDLRLSRAERGRVVETLARVGLEGLGARLPGTLSGGQQGRVALARALIRAQPLLLLDEPFSALGPALRAEMLDLVAEIVGEAGATLLMVTHDPADARRIADAVVHVDAGQALPPVPTAELLDNPPEALVAYLGKRPD